MKSITVSAKTIEKAIEEGLEQLGTTFENVDITVISEGGFLKKATVELTLSGDAAAQAEKTEAEQEILKPEEIKPEQKPVKKQGKEPKPEQKAKELPAAETEPLMKEVAPEGSTDQEASKVDRSEEVKVVLEEIEKFLNGLFSVYNITASVQSKYEDHEFFVTVNGENLGVLIGYHGEALESIQYILSNYIFNKTGHSHHILLDIENYRAKRAESLKSMASNLAEKAIQAGRSFKLEPMNSFERKVIHAHLQGMEHIATHSEGMEPRRFIVIDYVA